MGLLDTANIGDIFERQLIISEDLMKKFSNISGDLNPLHTNEKFAKNKGFPGRVAYGNILNLMLSALVGMDLNNDSVMLLSQRIDYKKPVFLNDKIIATGTISVISKAVRVVELSIRFVNQEEVLVAKASCSFKCI